ncbi:MAG: PocR ligand-binding domain-containing protein [Lachnospiraceae bacterium]|nr:PocR ligand-binding domain-containing protein [Lachnospiraceae bacterium]
MSSLYLTDLIDQSTLQKIQDAFSNMVGMAALTTDSTGLPVTEGSNFTEYCMKYTRQSKVGCARCEECDRYGAVMTQESGHPTSYFCHSGLIDFAAPIIADGKMVGSFIGGQVLTEKPDPEKIRKVAEEIGVDFDEYWAAIEKVQIIPKEKIDNATDFLFTIASVLSDMAMGKHQALIANAEIEHAAKMKTDFLANMSHEIRTPMNAIIGMSEMALREELSDNARDYINQIKSSGRALLTIINDILDFSKIESGKLDIQPIEYDSMSLFNDVINIIQTRLVDKDVELFLDITPDLPVLLYGDNIRIRQILINLANNAAKFTHSGEIRIVVDFERFTNTKGELTVSVIDTGIGIKEENLHAIFESFSQVDSTRNRNVEGTGLGLAITQRLINLMNGTLNVESEYGKGSIFSFSIPQDIADFTPAMNVIDNDKKCAISIFKNDRMANFFAYDTERLGIQAYKLSKDADISQSYKSLSRLFPDKEFFLFLDHDMLTDERKDFIENHPEIHAALISDFVQDAKINLPNLMIVKKPLSSMNLSMIFNKEKVVFTHISKHEDDSDFIAPDANVLIVDDNIVNLTVAEGLLEPLKLNTISATSGMEAIKRIQESKFDLIFMDHMMPEMDGIMTTQEIRNNFPEYNDIPIIALTANAVGNAKDMFLEAGMNDFIAKPIEVRTLIKTVKKWLPPEKIQKLSDEDTAGKSTDKEASKEIVIGDLEIAEAIRMLGNEKIYWNVLKEYHRMIPSKAKSIQEHFDTEDWNLYTIEVHALKSSSRQIGAIELSNMAAKLEKAGKENDIEYIRANNDAVLKKYLEYDTIIAPFFEEDKSTENVEKKTVDYDELKRLFEQLREAIDSLDSDEMESICDTISEYQLADEQAEYAANLKTACEDLDFDTCNEILDEWEKLIK